MGKTAKIFMVFAIIATIVFGVCGTLRIVKHVQFSTNCTQYIKRAADANTIETAKEELAKVISYAEEHNLTEGIVSIFLHQPKNDIGYWYKNLTESYSELDNLSEDATSLEKTNVLMKLRETLTDDTSSGISVTIPDGISVYPSNIAFFWWILISMILTCALWKAVYIADTYYWD